MAIGWQDKQTATRVRPRQSLANAQKLELARLIERGQTRPQLDGRTAEEIIGYDKNGLPA